VAPDTLATSVPALRALSAAGNGHVPVNNVEIADNFAAITARSSREFKEMNDWRDFSEDTDDDSWVGHPVPERRRSKFCGASTVLSQMNLRSDRRYRQCGFRGPIELFRWAIGPIGKVNCDRRLMD
jgi:hypothetical protein